ncbi:unnamed protein product [Ranitomeya imitator]|uniref:Uncharacterized protein n=1 Tax=Ranitomeya imitator TaxID=111125 RepID=A0ABN9L5I3_9NEOB|nr:unnamed protein product [Ranitomeya imitator]
MYPVSSLQSTAAALQLILNQEGLTMAPKAVSRGLILLVFLTLQAKVFCQIHRVSDLPLRLVPSILPTVLSVSSVCSLRMMCLNSSYNNYNSSYNNYNSSYNNYNSSYNSNYNSSINYYSCRNRHHCLGGAYSIFLLLMTCMCEPAFICEEHRAPVVKLPILVFCGKCQASCTVLGCDR